MQSAAQTLKKHLKNSLHSLFYLNFSKNSNKLREHACLLFLMSVHPSRFFKSKNSIQTFSLFSPYFILRFRFLTIFSLKFLKLFFIPFFVIYT
ncbi:unnamed protein product [Meloidogyne enterolobii]|uniref:Uncharacterized protein n=1 Tax=Meloidogyne enterolobii TaxID=390850 RepID=A0ACB0YR92_MELEN